jgi:hypothetical protein
MLLNLFNGKNPGRVWLCTASGASSLSRLRSAWTDRPLVPVGLPRSHLRAVASASGFGRSTGWSGMSSSGMASVIKPLLIPSYRA